MVIESEPTAVSSVEKGECHPECISDPFLAHLPGCDQCRLTPGLCPAGAELLFMAALEVLTP